MICINFPAGALGHFLVRSIYHHWPTIFPETISHDYRFDNHLVPVNFFLKNTYEITQTQTDFLRRNKHKQSIILCHNAELIPVDVRQDILFININCGQVSKSQCAFLFMCKAGSDMIHYALQQNQLGFDFYEIMLKEFCRLASEPFYPQSGASIEFSELESYAMFAELLHSVQNYFDLDDPIEANDWYNFHYRRSTHLLMQYRDQFEIFERFFSVIVANPKIYLDIDPHTLPHFTTCVDFFVELSINTQE